jgi:7-cyano-7-deazaguanine synthase
VETVGFDYGQRHRVELEARQRVLAGFRERLGDLASALGRDEVLELPALAAISETALTRDVEITFSRSGLPTTFVPGRNLLFLTYAGALAYRRGAGVLVGGMCETDFSGYPDCRRATLDALETAIGLGMDRPIRIDTPLMFIDKAATWQMAWDLGERELVDLIVEETHTCYLGHREPLHPWGRGCGTCPACELRAKGWKKWRDGRDAES